MVDRIYNKNDNQSNKLVNLSHFIIKGFINNNSNNERDLSFQDLFKTENKDDRIVSILMSTFVCDWNWLAKQLSIVIDDCYDHDHLPLCQVAINYDRSKGTNSGRSEQEIGNPFLDGSQTISLKLSENKSLPIDIIHPPLLVSQIGILHSKIILLEYQQIIRVVISSSNLTGSDWEVLGQTIFIVDIPRIKKNNIDNINDNKDQFKYELVDILSSLGFTDDHIVNALDQFDFSMIHQHGIHIVSSIPGVYSHNKYGLSKLASLASEYQSTSKATAVYQSSAIGMTSREWLSSFKAAIGTDNLTLPFPTLNTIDEMITYNPLGATESVTIRYHDKDLLLSNKMLSKLQYNNERDPKVDNSITNLSSHPPLHSKVLITDRWIYHGSHNFTEASWGSISKRQSTIKISNFETGVFIPTALFTGESIQSMLRFKVETPLYDFDDIPWQMNKHYNILFNNIHQDNLDNNNNNNQDSNNSLNYHWNQFKKEQQLLFKFNK
ncbi:hypothetical protein PPL_01939 [Heterostelium album PN500]|uniref:Tyrosyl-DNA phosphodiesterase n=1 Tax=Heterostelium pallidum (strain ATCC 26659 / Pp 5 / PN500) TaxID=670386 RepID=D3B0X2_HETP5|nr:hypothetical protein PPL_01939 [Heterostelium album PN500]EFA84946.1 hypothetical protein PPL_01939 [Heterostelium album PN500]|eukprot:XP_020437056.1 hypothetical protein PPL_01939 [Heterostelium album PN500]